MCECRFFRIEDGLHFTVCILLAVIYLNITEIERIFDYLISVLSVSAELNVNICVTPITAFVAYMPFGSSLAELNFQRLMKHTGRFERFKHKLLNIGWVYPSSAEANIYLACGQRFRHSLLQGFNIYSESVTVQIERPLRRFELLADITGQIFICRNIFRLIGIGEMKRIEINNARKVGRYLFLGFARELHHKRHIYLCFLGNRYRESLGRCINARYLNFRLYSALCEHISLAVKFTVLVKDFERA